MQIFHFSYLYLLVLRVQGVVYVAKITIFSVILYIYGIRLRNDYGKIT